MKPLRTLAGALVSLCGAVGLAPARAGDAPPFRLEERVPVSTLCLVAVEGFPAGWRTALAATPLGPLLARADVDAAIRPLFDLLRRGLERAGSGEALLARVAPVLADLDGRLEVALVGVSEDGVPGVVVSLDFGANLSRFVRFLSTLGESLPAGWSAQEEAPGVADAFAYGISDGSSRWVVRVTGTTVVAQNRGDVVVSARPAAGAASSLAALPAFVEAFGGPAAPGGASVRAYANLASVVARAVDDPGASLGGRFASAAGLRSLTTLSYRAAVEEGTVVETLRLGAAKAQTGVFSLFRTSPLAGASPLPEPRRTWLHLESSLPVSTWPSRWRAFLHDVDTQDEGEFVRDLERWNHVLGADLESGLLARLGDEQTLSAGLSDAGGAFPDVVLSIPVRDVATFEPMLARAVDGLCGDRTDHGDEAFVQRGLRVGDRTIHVVELRAKPGGEAAPFSPTWALVHDRLVVTLVPHTMRALLARLGPGRPPGDAGGTGRAAGLASARPFGTALAVATKDLLSSAYDTLVPLVETVPSWKRAAEAAGFDPARLPAASEMVDGWSDTVVSLRVGPDGVEFRARSPIGVVPLAGLVLASLHAAATPGDPSSDAPPSGDLEPSTAVSAASDDPKRLTSGALDRIARALQEFVSLRGSFPATLDELTTTERLLSAVPRDAWDRPLRYSRPAPGAPAIVASAGPNGVFDDDDDVTVDVEAPAK